MPLRTRLSSTRGLPCDFGKKGFRRAIPDEALAALRRTITGEVVTPTDTSYDEARAVWNAMIDAFPAVLVQVGEVSDVAPAIAFARAHGLELAIRGGGHNVAGKGTAEGGLVLDLAALREVAVDPQNRTVRVQGGATLADVDASTTGLGLAVPIGVVSGTGIGGFTLGGGVGWLTRAHGLAADNLLSATLITADGDTVVASAQEDRELLWALRGGGGNFGVVVEFTFRAHPLGPEVLCANFVYGLDRWPEAWHALAHWTADLPDAMTTITTTLTPPPIVEMGDDPLLIVGCAWASADVAAGQALLDNLRAACPPDDEIVGPTPWPEWQSAFDVMLPKGVRAYWRNVALSSLSDGAIEVLVRRGTEQTWTGTGFDVHHMGGAFSRVDVQDSPFPSRSSPYWVNIYGFWTDADDDASRVAFVRGMAGDLEPLGTGGHYVNFQGREEEGHRLVDTAATFGPEAYQLLVAVKRRLDPENVFHINQNIAPG